VKALSIHEPWAWLIVQGYKDVENRVWSTRYRGPILVHAGLTRADPEDVQAVLGRLNWLSGRKLKRQMPALDSLPTGGFVGVVNIADCITESDSDWFEAPYGFLLQNPRPVPFVPYRGRLGLFDVEVESVPGLAEALREQGR
jgi:hypothetical protein